MHVCVCVCDIVYVMGVLWVGGVWPYAWWLGGGTLVKT